MALRMYARFWLITALLLVIPIVWFGYGGGIDISRIGQHTLYAAGIMLVVFLFGYAETHGVVYRLFKDLQAMDILEKIAYDKDAQKNPAAFRNCIVDLCADPAFTYARRTRVGEALYLLAVRYDISRAHKVKTPINRSVFQDDFDARIENDTRRLSNLMVLYLMLGFFAFITVLYLTFKGLPVPKTLEEIGEYNTHLLTGLGLTYLLTIIGIGAGTITHFINMRVCDRFAGILMERFRGVMFSVIFPVLHGSLALSDGARASADREKKEGDSL